MTVAIPRVGAQPRLVFFHSHCRGIAGASRASSRRCCSGDRNHGTFDVVRVAEEERPDLLERFRIQTVPTLVVVQGKAVAGRLERPRGCREIEGFLSPGCN